MSKDANSRDVENHFRLIAAAALVDGKVHGREMSLLKKLAGRLGLPEEHAVDVLKELDQKGEEDIDFPTDPEVQEAVFRDMLAMVVADDELTEEEEEILLQVGRAMERSDEQVKEAIKAYMAERG